MRGNLFDADTEAAKALVIARCKTSRKYPDRPLTQSEVEKLARNDARNNDACAAAALAFVAHINRRDRALMKGVHR